MIRITIERDEWVGWNGRTVEASVLVYEFRDHENAANWLVEDSYFAEPYTRKVVYEVV